MTNRNIANRLRQIEELTEPGRFAAALVAQAEELDAAGVSVRDWPDDVLTAYCAAMPVTPASLALDALYRVLSDAELATVIDAPDAIALSSLLADYRTRYEV